MQAAEGLSFTHHSRNEFRLMCLERASVAPVLWGVVRSSCFLIASFTRGNSAECEAKFANWMTVFNWVKEGVQKEIENVNIGWTLKNLVKDQFENLVRSYM